MGKFQLLVADTGATQGKDVTNLVKQITWTGRKGAAARTLSVVLLDDDGHGHARSDIQIEDGWHCFFYYDGAELFRGIFMSQTGSNTKTAEYKAYDIGIYLSNNRDTFCYENKTASDIFRDVCGRFGIPTATVAQCAYTIPDLTKKKTTAWDAIADALSLEYDNVGIRHYVFCEKGALSLRIRNENILQWVLETGTNITKYKDTKSIENVKTRIKLLSDEGTVLAVATDSSLESRIGTMQDVDTPDETLNTAQIKQLANTMLEEKKQLHRSLQLVNVLGISDVISGVGVYVSIPHLKIGRTFYVDSDTHTFSDNAHFMTLTLSCASDIGKNPPTADAPESEPDATFREGDVVEFNGDAVYYYPSVKIPSWVKRDYYHVVTQVDYPKGSGRPVTKGGVKCVLLGKKKLKSGGSTIDGISTWTDCYAIHKV